MNGEGKLETVNGEIYETVFQDGNLINKKLIS